MLLGIPYHVAMAYREGQGWIMNSGEGAMAFNWIAQTIHIFRMPAFFLIAGYFTALLLARRMPGEWLGGRLAQLGIPLLAALLTINPLLNIFCELSNFSWWAALGSFDHNSTTSGGYLVRHLWFLIVLLYLSGFAALTVWLMPRLRDATLSLKTDSWIARNLTLTLIGTAIVLGLWEGGVIELFWMGGLATNLLQQWLRLDQLIEFGPWFLLGCIVARAPALRHALYRFSWPVALLAVATLTANLLWREQVSWQPYGRFMDALAAVFMTQLLFTTIKRIADRPSPLVQEIVRGSFTIYLFHMPIMAGLILLGMQLAIPLSVKAVLVMALTMALSWAVWIVVRRSPLLSLLYAGVTPKKRAAARSAELATTKLRHEH